MVAPTGLVRQASVAHSRFELPTRIGLHLPASNPPFLPEQAAPISPALCGEAPIPPCQPCANGTGRHWQVSCATMTKSLRAPVLIRCTPPVRGAFDVGLIQCASPSPRCKFDDQRAGGTIGSTTGGP